MISRVEWETYSDKTNSRIIEWDDEPTTYEEMVMILEVNTTDKVKRIYPYEPKPMFINLFAEIYVDDNLRKQRLVLHLNQNRNIKTDRSLAKIKCFGKLKDAEWIYQSIRITYSLIVDEEGLNTLYFEEFKQDKNGKYHSTLMTLLGIYQIATHYSSEIETLTTPLEQMLLDSWNELSENDE